VIDTTDPSDQQALTAAARWARRYGVSRYAFERSVTAVRTAEVTAVRARWTGQTRRVRIATTVTSSRARKLAEPLQAERFDPWSVDPEAVPGTSRQLARCRSCQGDKRVVCPECAGSRSQLCAECGGSGQGVSTITGNPIQCPSCRGGGRRRCPCRSGRIACPGCGGKGKAEEWVEIEQASLVQVRTTPANELSHAFPDFADPVEFDRAEALPLAPSRSWTGVSTARASEAIDVVERLGLGPKVDPRCDRLAHCDVQVFRDRVTEVEYRLFGRTSSLRVRGLDGAVVDDGGAGPLRLWSSLVGAAVVTTLLWGLLCAGVYALRDPWYARSGEAIVLGLVALLLPPAAGFGLAGLGSGLARRSAAVRFAPLVLLFLLQVGCFLGGQPRLDQVRRLVVSGDDDAALQTAEAAWRLGVDADRAAAAHDEIQVRLARRRSQPRGAWEATRWPFLTASGRAGAVAHAALVTASEAADTDGQQALRVVLSTVPEEHRSRPEVAPWFARLHLGDARRCVEERRGACVVQQLAAAGHAGATAADQDVVRRVGDAAEVPVLADGWATINSRQPFEVRLAACDAVRPSLRFLEDAGTGPAAWPTDRDQVDAACAGVRQEQEQEARRLAEQEARRLAERAEQARRPVLPAGSAKLRCRDGTLSPTCTCDRPSWRGCCSHHGGVARCSQ